MRYFLMICITVFTIANDDEALLKLAYKSGLRPVPTTYGALLATLHTKKEVLSKEKIILGKKLFFDKNLSLGRDISCATCHHLDEGGIDGKVTAVGHRERKNPFHLNTPTVLNTAFSKKLFWDGRSETLEEQAKGPLKASFEMSITPSLVERRLNKNPEYNEHFERIYGDNGLSFENSVDAIATYEKTIVTKGRFDDFLLGDLDALSKKEKAGLKLFISKGCVGCHTGIGLGGETLRKFPLTYHKIWSIKKPADVLSLQKKIKRLEKGMNRKDANLTQEEITLIENGYVNHNLQLSNDTVETSCKKCHVDDLYNGVKEEMSSKVAFPFTNRGEFLGAEDKQKFFRVPLLRNVVRTKPYFHNGSIEKLEEAIKLMGIHQSRVKLSESEIDEIISFLKAVDGPLVRYSISE